MCGLNAIIWVKTAKLFMSVTGANMLSFDCRNGTNTASDQTNHLLADFRRMHSINRIREFKSIFGETRLVLFEKTFGENYPEVGVAAFSQNVVQGDQSVVGRYDWRRIVGEGCMISGNARATAISISAPLLCVSDKHWHHGRCYGCNGSLYCHRPK